MINKTIIVAVLVSLATLTIQAQTKSRTKTIRPTPNSVKVAPTGTLSIEAALIYRSGDVKPVARATFLLLDEDLNTILKPYPVAIPRSLLSIWMLTTHLKELEAYADSEAVKAEAGQILRAIEAHVIASTTTDFGGKAKFEGLTPGKRFLFGEFKAGNNQATWYKPVEVKSGTNETLILSNDNATGP